MFSQSYSSAEFLCLEVSMWSVLIGYHERNVVRLTIQFQVQFNFQVFYFFLVDILLFGGLKILCFKFRASTTYLVSHE